MRYHQNIALNGKAVPAEYTNRKDSSFFNEGKWKNFILPFLPPNPTDMTFVEIGCNVGLYLRLATEYGFRNVVGVEANAANCAMAERYRDSYGLNYKVLNRTVGEDFSFDELPVADVVLLSNVHYYIHMEHFIPFLDRLRHKTVNCIIVSRRMNEKRHGHPLPEADAIRHMFRDWEMMRIQYTSSNMLKGDPHPRFLHSLHFRSQLQRQSIKDYTIRTQKYVLQQEWIDLIRRGEPFRLEDTQNWAYWVTRKQVEKDKPQDRWTDEQIRVQVQHRLDLVRDIMENGVREPLLAWPDRQCIDGGNRAAILWLLGYSSVIVRVI